MNEKLFIWRGNYRIWMKHSFQVNLWKPSSQFSYKRWLESIVKGECFGQSRQAKLKSLWHSKSFEYFLSYLFFFGYKMYFPNAFIHMSKFWLASCCANHFVYSFNENINVSLWLFSITSMINASFVLNNNTEWKEVLLSGNIDRTWQCSRLEWKSQMTSSFAVSSPMAD